MENTGCQVSDLIHFFFFFFLKLSYMNLVKNFLRSFAFGFSFPFDATLCILSCLFLASKACTILRSP